MSRVLDEQSAFFGTIPVPRMIQNQLNHLLEKIMEKSEKLITGILHGMYRTRKPNSWFVATLGAFLLLHARELDAGRLLYWNRNPDEVQATLNSFTLTRSLIVVAVQLLDSSMEAF
jgi:hypothetical protein